MLGLIVLAAACYGIIRAIWHVVVEIIEITAITLGSILAAAVVVTVIVCVVRWQHARCTTMAPLRVVTIDPARPPVIAASASGKPVQDAAGLFAEAVANGMDQRFVERILNVAMKAATSEPGR